MRSGLVALAAVGLLASVGRAELRFTETAADAGEVRSGLPLVHRFRFTNVGTQAAEIVELRPSCGCVRPTPGQRVYQAGEAGEIALEVHTLGEAAGPHRWTLQIAAVSNGVRSETTLVLTGRVLTEVSVQPGSLTVFADSAVAHKLLLTDHRPQTLQVRGVQSGAAWLTGRVTEQTSVGVCRIALEIAASCPEGRSEQVVSILTDDPVYRELRVPVTVVKRPRQRFTALPATVHLRRGPSGNASRIVLLEDRQDEAVIIDRVEADQPSLNCRWAFGPGKRATLRVAVDPSKAPRESFGGTVRVWIRGLKSEMIEIPVTCD